MGSGEGHSAKRQTRCFPQTSSPGSDHLLSAHHQPEVFPADPGLPAFGAQEQGLAETWIRSPCGQPAPAGRRLEVSHLRVGTTKPLVLLSLNLPVAPSLVLTAESMLDRETEAQSRRCLVQSHRMKQRQTETALRAQFFVPAAPGGGFLILP